MRSRKTKAGGRFLQEPKNTAALQHDLHFAQRVASELDVLQELAERRRVHRGQRDAGVHLVPRRVQDNASAQLVNQVLPREPLCVMEHSAVMYRSTSWIKGIQKKKKKGHKAQFFYESLLTQLVVISGTRLFPDSTISFCRFCWKKHSLTSAVQCSTTVSCCYWKTIDDGLAWRDEVLGVSVISKSRIGSFLLNYGNSTNDYNSLFIKEWGSSSVYICT